MPLAVDEDQQVVLSHRKNFIGRPTGPGTVSWDYKGKAHLIKRPGDGQPATSWQVKCAECGERLEFTVHSAQATLRRQARWRAWAWTGLAVLVVSVIGCFVIGGPALALLIPTAVAGAAVGYYVGGIAADEMGITGHGAGMPIVAKHALRLIESRPKDLPELICDECGHQEDYPSGSQYRKSWVEKQYQAAKQRLDAHPCRTRG